jgi:1-acyl-sn-glycerol-3-phosphate acyltransferase
VPIVPIAVLGTAAVLPKGAGFIPHAPMGVRIGQPVDPNAASTTELRAQVVALREDSLPQTGELARVA